MAKSHSRALASLLCWLLLSVGVFVFLPLYLGIRTHLYLYHATTEADPLRLFKAIIGLLIVVVVSAVALSSLLGRYFQRLLHRNREQIKIMSPYLQRVDGNRGVTSSGISHKHRRHDPLIRVVRPGYPGLDTHSEKTRVLEELVDQEQDEEIRKTLKIALEQHRTSADED